MPTDKKIMELPESTSPSGGSYVPIVDGPNDERISINTLSNVIRSNGIVTVTGDYDVGLTDTIILVDAISAAVNIHLPNPILANGKAYVIKKIDSSGYIVTVSSPTFLIDGVTNILISYQYMSYTFNSDPSNIAWWLS